MAGVTWLVLFVLITIGFMSSQNSAAPATYRITFSSRARPGMTLPVSVHLLKAGVTSQVIVKLLKNDTKEEISAMSRQVSSGAIPAIFLMTIPAQSSSAYEMQVKASGQIVFDRRATVLVDRKGFSIFVQTDKAVYKPGDTVLIRILAMNADLSIQKSPMDVLIKDPEGNIMHLWKEKDAGDTGVVELSMPISAYPLLGNWTIEVQILGQNETKTFLVDEYVLPKFGAIISVPKNLLIYSSLNGTVSAKYTFGRPLTEATAFVRVRLLRPGVEQTPNKTVNGTLDSKGEFKFSFTNEQLKDLCRRTFFTTNLEGKQAEVVAMVRDDATEHFMADKATVTFHKHEAGVEFLPITTNSFKPGLPYSVYLRAFKFDDTSFSASQSITMTFEITDKSSAITIINQVFNLQTNGFLPVNSTSTYNAASITIKATINDFSTSKTLVRAYSPSINFLKVIMNIIIPRVGDLAMFTALTTENIRSVHYQVYSKGIMATEARVDSISWTGSSSFTIKFPIDDSMAPNARLLVFYIRADGEVVADSISFKVWGYTNNPISVKYYERQVKPGENVTQVVRAKKDSFVFLLSVDKAVKLLKSGNDITQEQVTEELVAFDYGDEYRETWKYMSLNDWPSSARGSDAKSIFDDIKVHILTDGTLSEDPTAIVKPKVSPSIPLSLPEFDRSEKPYMPDVEVEYVRTYFPETWLWEMVKIGSSGVSMKEVTAPDTITTWLTTAFAVHPEDGLSVVPQAAELTTFQDVFVSLDLPYSAVRGEDICLRTLAFNYYNTSLQMLLTLGRSAGLNNILLQPVPGNPKKYIPFRQEATVNQDIGFVKSNTFKETDFCFTPTKVGNLSIRFSLTSSVPGDAVEHILKVEPEGSPEVRTITHLLEAKPNVPFTKTVLLNFPPQTVQGSQVIKVKITANLLVQVITSLEDILRLPYGCGEQNMMFFASNIFLVNYLQKTNLYRPALQEKIQRYLLTGYQQEIKYLRQDGSFSVWGQKDRSGSMWLTAFVTKCFVQAVGLKNSIITIDGNIIKSSIRWILQRQNSNGSFPEPGNVYHKEMQGGSAKGEAMTAFILISLAEAKNKFKDLNDTEQTNLQNGVDKAREYLEVRLSLLSDSYDLAIVTYALHLVASNYRDVAFERLKQRVKTKDSDKRYWERNANTTALNIEMTSYALLTHVLRKDVAGSLSILRWLLEMRGPNGGFVSTQDTVVGLQALAEMAIEQHSPIAFPFKVAVSWSSGGQGFKKDLIIDESTKLLLQIVELTIVNGDVPSKVNISASTNGTFRGFPEAKVVMEYNVNQPSTSKTFNMTYQIFKASKKAFILIVEAKRIDGQTGGMTIIEVGIPTGYFVDITNSNYSVLNCRQTEEGYRKYTLYYDEVDESGIRAVLPMSLSRGVPIKNQPVPIKIYSYFEPDAKQLTLYYQLSEKTVYICDNIAQYIDCTADAIWVAVLTGSF